MKPSHLTTPRSLSECNFTHGYVPGRARATDYGVAWWAAMCICAVAAVIVIAMTSGAPQ